MNARVLFRNVSKCYGTRKLFAPKREFWALRDVSFEVNAGETLGIIGPNGAGKTTILKLIANVTEASSGDIEVSGRMVPLIELNAGFHWELSGRENIFLNASILGLSRREIKRKFDEIIDFAGLQEFIDQPVKKYSSGMFARLGFSVAVHCDPEVFLIDEVLAVGDSNYQKMCLAKIKEFQKKGVIILFVSHDMDLVRQICQRALLLKGGEVVCLGAAQEASSRYS